jgi:hypothetical protein
MHRSVQREERTMRIGRLGVGSAIVGGVIGVAAMVGVGVGIANTGAFAQTPSPTPSATAAATKADRNADYLARLAANLGISVDALKAANLKTQNELVDEAVAAGRLTAEQGAQAKARLAESGGAHLGGHFHGKLHGRGGPGGMKGFGAAGPLALPAMNALSEVATFLGIDERTLITELMSGKSLAEIAQANGKSRDELKAELSAQFGSMIDALIDAKFPAMQRGLMPKATPGT